MYYCTEYYVLYDALMTYPMDLSTNIRISLRSRIVTIQECIIRQSFTILF